MKDLRNDSDAELSMWVFNDEGLYIHRHNHNSLVSILDELFIYTPEQMAELVQDIADDLEEEQNA